MATTAFTRPSRHDGPAHIVRVDADTLRPFACSCLAGQHQRLCWAVIDVAASDLVPLARRRWVEAHDPDELRQAAHVLVQTRKWAAAALELQALRPTEYRLTSRGAAAIATVLA